MVANSKLSPEQLDQLYDWIVDGRTVTECIKLIKKTFDITISYPALNKHKIVLAAKEARQDFLDREALEVLESSYATVIKAVVETIEALTKEQNQIRDKLKKYTEGTASYKIMVDRLAKVDSQLSKNQDQFMEFHKELKQSTRVVRLVDAAKDAGEKDDIIKSLLVTLERNVDKNLN